MVVGLRSVIGRALLVAAAVAAMLPATPAAAQVGTQSWQLESTSLTFRRGGEAYQLSLRAFEIEGNEVVQVAISQTRDPAGVRHAHQEHSYTFTLEDAFTHADNLGSAKVVTGRKMGKYGRVSVTFSEDGPIDRSCNGHNRSRGGTLSGTMELNTGTDRFETVAGVPARATLTHIDGQCQADVLANPCPHEGLDVTGFSEDLTGGFVFASKPDGEKKATIGMFWDEVLGDDSSQRLSHALLVDLPRRRVTIADNLGSATLRGAKGTWLSGASRFDATEPADRQEPNECGRGRESVYTTRRGTLNGTLKATSWLGSGMRADDMFASADKIVVRDR